MLTRNGEYAVSMPWLTFKRNEHALLCVISGGAGFGCIRLLS